MLLHELPTKTARHLRIIVTRTDISIPATIALRRLMKARVRQTQWFPTQGYSAAQIKAVTGALPGYVKHPPPTIDPDVDSQKRILRP
jgi:hypothetical protein